MCKKIIVTRNEKVMKVPKRNIAQYLSVELGMKLQEVSSNNSIGMNSLCEFGLRKMLGMDTKYTEVKEVVIK